MKFVYIKWYDRAHNKELKGNLCGVDNDAAVDDENGCENIRST